MDSTLHRGRICPAPQTHERQIALKRNNVPDYYAILGVTLDASQKDIQKAYRELVAKYHPDKHQGNALEDLAKEKLAELNEAYGILSNPEKRAAYDVLRQAERMGTSSSSAASWSTPPPGPGSDAPRPRSYPKRTTRSPFLFLLICAVAFLAMRFLKSPRLLTILAVVLFAVWFGPRLLRLIKK